MIGRLSHYSSLLALHRLPPFVYSTFTIYDSTSDFSLFTYQWPTVFMERSPSDSYSLTLRVRLSTRAGTLGEVATAIGRAGGDIGAIDIVSAGRDHIIRDITVNTVSSE